MFCESDGQGRSSVQVDVVRKATGWKSRTAFRPWWCAEPLGKLAALALCGCAAVYPELQVPLSDVSDERALDAPPPANLVFIRFDKAQVPSRAPDGRFWDEDENDPPDLYARLFLDGTRLIETPVEQDTLTPVWPPQRPVNYLVPKGADSRVELWDQDTVHDRPICVKSVGDLRAEADFGETEVLCDNGTRIWLIVLPARAKIGLGFLYELRATSVFVSRVLSHSPAARAELRVGDEIVRLRGKPVAGLDEAEIRSEFNAGARNGLALQVRSPDGKVREMKLKEGAVYLTPEESRILGFDSSP